MKISLIQLQILTGEESGGEALTERVMGLIDSCAGSDLIVLPELWNVGLLSYRTIWNFAEESDGPLMRRISEKAKKLNAFIHCGSFAEKCGDKLYNACILFDRKGTDLAEYRKIHLFSCYGHEADTFTHGDKAVVVDTGDFGRVGLSICYDIRFPELFRRMTAGLGAEVFIAPTAWPYPRKDAFTMCARVRALENSAHVFVCNMTGPYKHLRMLGNSAMIDTWGDPVYQLGEEPCILHCEFDIETTRRQRRDFPTLNDLRLGKFD